MRTEQGSERGRLPNRTVVPKWKELVGGKRRGATNHIRMSWSGSVNCGSTPLPLPIASLIHGMKISAVPGLNSTQPKLVMAVRIATDEFHSVRNGRGLT